MVFDVSLQRVGRDAGEGKGGGTQKKCGGEDRIVGGGRHFWRKWREDGIEKTKNQAG